MPLDVVRLIDSDLFALSTGDEFKAAVALWCKSWLQLPAGSLPKDDRVLAHLSLTGSRWPKVKSMALRGWIECSDGRLYHAVVAAKACDAWEHRKAQRARANKRWGNTGGDENPTPGNAGPMPRHSDGNATASTAAHATAMQGTGTVKGLEKKEPPTLRVVPPLRKSRVDPNWWPDEAGQRKAAESGISDLNREVVRFRDHHASKGSLMADWAAAWRTWCGNAMTYAKPKPRWSPGPRGALEVMGLLDDEPEAPLFQPPGGLLQ